MTDLHVYLAVLKASYDYDPQSDDELPIKENQILLLLDKVDDDWWKVKIKSDVTDDEGPSGLVPAAYVEPADHVSVVKVLYDYDASSSGELSVKEDEVLLVYETDQDWLLVQSRTEDGKAGYVPGNYVEATSEEESTSATTPKATRPVSTYVDPADRVASSKTSQPNTDTIKTWPVTDIDKKGKKKKGTLGIGNGAIFFASESDKTPVQKWQTSDVVDVVVEKGKQIRIDVGGATLHYNTGSKENAEAIQEKIQSSRSQSNSRGSQDLSVDGPLTGRKVGKKVSVHFSQSDPVIIPPREEEEEGEGDLTDEQQEDDEENEGSQEKGVALYDFTADGDDELSIKEGEQLLILEKDGDEWWKCQNTNGEEGVVPASYLEVPVAVPRMYSPPLPARSNASAEKERAEAAAKAAREIEERAELARRQREEEQALARKKQEAQRAKELAAETEKRKREEEAARSSPALAPEPKKTAEDEPAGRSSAELKRPPSDQVRTWHDRTGQFRVDAAFLGVSNNKIRLHKVNGVVVEVPTEKMSVNDMRYVEKLMKKTSKSSQKVSDDDVPLPLLRSQRSSTSKKPKFDWFDFFLSAGCDVDDCTRYATSFEKDKVDETILPDITESTMRTLGLREGDIIRVTKAIEKRKSAGKQANPLEAQIRSDEELARQIQALETAGGSPRSPAPNLFAGPGGVLKAPRRRPQPTKSLPPAVDIKAIKPVSSPSDQASGSQPTSSSSTPVQPPARSSSAAPVVSQFDDDAWTNRPSSAKPATSTPPSAAQRSSPAPPTSAPLIPTGTTIAQAASPILPPQANGVSPPVNNSPSPNPIAPTSSLAKTTESDIFNQLARLNDLRKPATPTGGPSSATPFINAPPPASYPAGLGMGSSPLPIGQHLQNQSLQSQQPVTVPSPSPQAQIQPQLYNGPRGPYAPVPVNQGLLQPLVPAQNTFSGFVPTRPASNTNATAAIPSFQAAPQPPFLAAQPTGLPNQIMLPQATGVPFGGFSSTSHMPSTLQSTGSFGPMPTALQSQFTGFNPGNFMVPPPVPPLPVSATSSTKDTSPANVFAQMKSGTFANEDESQPQSAGTYNALQPAPLLVQQTGWTQPYQSGFVGYPR